PPALLHAGRERCPRTAQRVLLPNNGRMSDRTPAPPSMTYQRVGRSGLHLPRISLGLWQNFGENRPLDVMRDVLLRAYELGITHFDLANNYGPPPGAAEVNFGRILREDFAGLRN